MTDKPAVTPVTMPEADPIVATVGVVDVHAPPVAGSLRTEVAPTHTLRVPVIVPGVEFMVTVFVI